MAAFHVRLLKIISIVEIVILILAFLVGLIIAISLSLVEVRDVLLLPFKQNNLCTSLTFEVFFVVEVDLFRGVV